MDDELFERLTTIEKLLEKMVASFDKILAKKPRKTIPEDYKPSKRKERTLLEAVKKLKDSPHYYIFDNFLSLVLNINTDLNTDNINTEQPGYLKSEDIPKLSEFISQVAGFNLKLIQMPKVNPKRELEKFCTYYLNTVDAQNRMMYTKYTHWDLAFRNWCNKAQKFSNKYPEEKKYYDEIERPDYEEREKRETGYEGGPLAVSEASEEYEAEFLSR